ncbi:MAG: flagellar M-ring protein FliF [Alphaproteobacteria bacterium]|nr:flagellar M-ring protein FliF [Alphaproteobacteria bacterium]
MSSFINSMRGLGTGKLASMAGVALLLMGILIYMSVRLGGTNMVPLYSDLEPADAKNVITRLDEQRVLYEVRNNGSEILVPADAAMKLKVETSDLLDGGENSGYGIFDNADALGSTSFVQNVNLVRAMEGELARTIRGLDNIRAARVHLVLPKRELFSRDEQKPSASVVVKMRRGTLSQKQVMAIQKLVSAAVPKLDPKNVAITDTKGTLLSPETGDDISFTASRNEEIRRAQEKRLMNAIQYLLERSLGPGKVRAEVTLEMDFDQVVTNKELYDPETQVVRSQTTIEETARSDDKESQPVTASQNIPDANMSSAAQQQTSASNRTEETVNYEISKEIINQVRNSGIIKKMSVAVIVDGTYSLDDEGKKLYQPRNEKEMEQIASLVRSAVGYDANRGDQVEVVNMRFTEIDDIVTEEEKPFFMGLSKSEVIGLMESLGVAIVAILVILLVVRPLVSKAFETGNMVSARDALMTGDTANLIEAAGGMLPGIGEEMQLDDLIDIAKVEGQVKVSSLKKISEIVDKHPEEALNIIRSWLYRGN